MAPIIEGGKMGAVTVKRELLFENIEEGLKLAGMLIDQWEAHGQELPECRATVGKALASLELLRASGGEDV
jgi:hypothetical protein